MNISCPLCLSDSPQEFFRQDHRVFGQRTFYRCKNCALIYLDFRQHLLPDHEKKRYELHENSLDDEGYVEFLNQLVIPLNQRLNVEHCGLDYGCGPSPTVSYLFKKRGIRMKDYDPYFFPNQECLNQTYDFITCTEVAEHFYRPRIEFKKLGELLANQESILAVMTGLMTDSIDFSSWHYQQDPTHVCFYSKETLSWLSNWMNWRVEYPVKNVVFFSPNT